jgi:hypothetical protein
MMCCLGRQSLSLIDEITRCQLPVQWLNRQSPPVWWKVCATAVLHTVDGIPAARLRLTA